MVAGAAPAVLAPRTKTALGSRRLLPVSLVLAVVVVLLLGLVGHPVRVRSQSMEPTLRPGDHLLVRTWGVGSARPARGQLVVLRGPDGADLVKRVAGLPGDEVGIADGLLVVDGVEVPEPYLDQPSVDGTWFGPVVVPPGEVFVLGDHRADSIDSRRFGTVPWAAITGIVVSRLWPVGGPGISPTASS